MSVITLFSNSEFYEAYYAAAKILSVECDTFLFKKRLGNQPDVLCAGFPKSSLDKFSKLLQSKGYTVVVQTELNLEVVNQTSQVLNDDSHLDSDIDLIQECIDSLHTCYSRLHYYASQRISNRFKQPGKYLLKCKAKEVRGFLEKLNKSLLCWHDANLQELRNPAFHQYLSDLAYIIRLVQYDSNLRQMNKALQGLYQALIRLIPAGESVQLSLFDSQVTFFEEIKESKFIHKVMIDFEWVPVLAFVGRLLRRFYESFYERVIIYPFCLVFPKSSWRSAFSGCQLSFADFADIF